MKRIMFLVCVIGIFKSIISVTPKGKEFSFWSPVRFEFEKGEGEKLNRFLKTCTEQGYLFGSIISMSRANPTSWPDPWCNIPNFIHHLEHGYAVMRVRTHGKIENGKLYLLKELIKRKRMQRCGVRN